MSNSGKTCMASQVCLLGPSELRRPNLPKGNRTLMTTSELQNPSLSNLKPLLEFVDFRNTKDELDKRGKEAWKVSPLQTLKLIFSLRPAGRLDDDVFYKTILWLHKNHPLTLALNFRVLGDLGLFKDLLGILDKVLEESICKHYVWTPYGNWRTSNGYLSSFLEGYQCLEKEKIQKHTRSHGWYEYDSESDEYDSDNEKILKEGTNWETKAEEVVAAWRRADDICKAKIAVERYQNDRSYQDLHYQVADVFAEFLKSDLKFLESGEVENISSAAKFCPSIDSKYDKETLICESIAKRIFPREDYEEYSDILEPHYGYRVRDRLRKQVLVPLRHALCQRLNNAAAGEMKMTPEMVKALKSLEMYRKILYYEGTDLLKQCMKIVGIYGDGLKLPHQVINSLNNGQISDEIVEGQWLKLIRGLSSKGKLRNCVAVCDIPESLRGTTYESVCIAMGLLISELGEYSWKGRAFSFSDHPKLHKIEGVNLRTKYEFMKQLVADSAKKLNFGDIYDRVLEIAVKEKLPHHKMPERIFVFTNKDFDTAFKNDWFDDYAKALKDYKRRGSFQKNKRRGYVFNVPDMVFWNLKDSIDKPVAIYSPVKDQDVGMIMTGFSSNLLRLFLNAESDSRSNSPQFKAPYGFSCSFAPQLIPRLEDVFSCAVFRDELKNLLVFD